MRTSTRGISPSHILTGFEIGWPEYTQTQASQRPEIQIWVGGPTTADLDLTNFAGCSGACSPDELQSIGFVPLSVFQNVQDNMMQSVSTTVAGRYVLIAGARGEWDDYFKVQAARTSDYAQVPEPSSLSLILGAGAALGLLVRRRRRAAQPA
jgi:hypothetical protein